MSRTTLLLIGSLLAIGAALMFIPIAHPTNCGGNSAALSQVHGIALIAWVGASDRRCSELGMASWFAIVASRALGR